VEHEDGAAAVAGDADQQHRSKSVAQHRRGQRRREDDQPDHDLQRRVPQPQPGIVARTEQEHRQRKQHQRRQDHGLGHRDGPTLGDRGEPDGEHVGAADDGVVDAVGVAEWHVAHPQRAQPGAGQEGGGAHGQHQDRQQQWKIHAVPQREVVVGAAGHGVGVFVEHVVKPRRPDPEHQSAEREYCRCDQE
jgi:hypothetical protein